MAISSSCPDSSESLLARCAARPLMLSALHAHGIEIQEDAGALASLCRACGLEPNVLLAEVDAAEHRLTEPWRAQPLPALIEHVLLAYHQPFAAELDRLDAALLATRQASAPQALEELRALLAELRAELLEHLAKEEQVLFPWILAPAPAAAARAIRAMQLEHEDTVTLLHTLHGAAVRAFAGSPSDPQVATAQRALAQFERWLCEHLHLEDHLLFARALESVRGQRPG